MLLAKKALHLGLLLVVLAPTVLVNQAMAAIVIEIPVSASNKLIGSSVTEALTSTELDEMKAYVAATTVQAQSTITYNQTTGKANPRPMESILRPLMQKVIMYPMMESLADPTNPDGAVYLFAPEFVKKNFGDVKEILSSLPPIENSTPPPSP